MIQTFEYSLLKAGWAKVKILNENNVGGEFVFSYLSDPLHDLITTLNYLLKTANTLGFVTFAQEPGEIVFVLTGTENQKLHFEIYYHKDLVFEQDIEKIKKSFEKVYEEEDTLHDFSKLVYLEAKKLLETYGEEGYKRNWLEYDFPMHQYKELENLLKLAPDSSSL